MGLTDRFTRRAIPGTLSGNGAAAARELERLQAWHGRALWDRLEPGWALDGLLNEVNRARGLRNEPPLERAVLAEAIAAAAAQDAEGSRLGHWGRQAVVPAIVALVVALYWTRPAPQMVVTTTKTLPAYHVLTAGDLTASPAVFTADAPSEPATVVGRYVARAVKRGEALRASELVDGSRLPGLATRTLLALPVMPVDAKRAATLPAIVGIEPAARAPADLPNLPKPLAQVYLLALATDAKGTTATVALTAEQLQQLRPALSRFDLHLAWPAAN